MPNRSSKEHPRDLKYPAADVTEAATSGEPEVEPAGPAKDPLAVELGRRGGLKGGKARAAKLTPEERRAIARKAADARWRGRTTSGV